MGVAVNPGGTVYVSDTHNHRVQYFTSTGSFLGKWGSRGAGNGQFSTPLGVAALHPYVYVADVGNHRIQYFTSSGSFLGKWGSLGGREGQFRYPAGVATYIYRPYDPGRGHDRVYVTDALWARVQYFRWSGPAVAPASLGRVKALFR